MKVNKQEAYRRAREHLRGDNKQYFHEAMDILYGQTDEPVKRRHLEVMYEAFEGTYEELCKAKEELESAGHIKNRGQLNDSRGKQKGNHKGGIGTVTQ